MLSFIEKVQDWTNSIVHKDHSFQTSSSVQPMAYTERQLQHWAARAQALVPTSTGMAVKLARSVIGVWKKSGEKILVMASTSNADPVLSPANHTLVVKYRPSSWWQERSMVQRRSPGLRNRSRLEQ